MDAQVGRFALMALVASFLVVAFPATTHASGHSCCQMAATTEPIHSDHVQAECPCAPASAVPQCCSSCPLIFAMIDFAPAQFIYLAGKGEVILPTDAALADRPGRPPYPPPRIA